MHFGVLGPVVVSGESGNVDVGGRRQRRLLAALIAHVNEVVSTDRLIDIVFEGEPPQGATTTIRSYVARLRRALGDASPIVTEPPGYLLRLATEDLDVMQFTDALAFGRRQLVEQDAVGAVVTLREALGLWRGRAYDEFTYEEWARAEVLRLEELRTVAYEEMMEAQLACGLAEEVIPELSRLVNEHPLRDRLRSQLMLALYRAGRQVEALRTFEDHRQALIEVGLEPSAEMLALEQSVALHDQALQLSAPAGRALRGYRLGDRIGQGTHGAVLRALQPGVGRDVAVKAIRAELANDPVFIRRFDTEAQLVSRLEHPHIVPLYDFWREPGGAYLVMRLLESSLAERLRSGPLEPQEAVRLAEQVGSALSAAHRAGVIHGDLKPSNVLLDGDGNAYLSDFGVASLIGHGDAAASSVGRSGYEAPELLTRDGPSRASDQFALAVLIVQTLTGVLPFGTRAIASPHERAPSICVQRPSVPAPVDEVVWRATAWSPKDRYPNVTAFVEALAASFGGAVDTQSPIGEQSNPYKGLRAFGESDRQDFFGRRGVVDELLARIGGADGVRFVTVVGASGSGKSSVVRAGLLPRLREGAVPGSDRWFIATMIPGAQPFVELEMALRSIAVGEPEEGTYGDDAVRRILRAAVPAGEQVLLVIDQLEELFTAVGDENTRRSFLDGLSAAVTDPGSNLRVVATFRADFFDRPLRYHEFGTLFKAGVVALVGMTATDLDQAIREPAALHGVEVEPALATAIVSDVVNQPAALPLLQYTMTELFERRTGRAITQASYRRVGGVDAAVARRADLVLDQLPALDHELVRKLFLRLVTIDENGIVTRRRARRSELMSLAEGAGDAATILEVFGSARLLTFDRDPSSREPTVEVAHEAMIHHWPRLSSWVDEAGDELRIQSHLTEAAGAWDRQGRDAGDLYRGARLEAASIWAHGSPDSVSSLERAFLAESIDLAEAEKAAEQERIDQQRRANRRLRGLLAGVGLTLVIAVIAGFVAVEQRNEARRQGQIATVRELAAASSSNLGFDPELSLLLALEAVYEMSRAGVYLAEAEQALHTALLADRLLVSAPNHGNGLAHLSPNGDVMIMLTHPEGGEIPQLWSVAELEPVIDLVGHQAPVVDGVFSPDGRRIATASEDHTVRLWDAATGEQLVVMPMEVESCLDAGRTDCHPLIPAFSSDGSKLAVSSAPGDVWIWNLDTEEVETRIVPTADIEVTVGLNLAFSPDDTLLAVSYSSPTVGLWNTVTGQLTASLRDSNAVDDLDFTPDGTKLVTGGRDRVAIWDVDTTELIDIFTEHEAGVRDLQVSADGRLVASGGDADVLVWELDTLEVVQRVIGHGGDVDGIDISRDGSLLVTGSWVDRTTRLWDLSPLGSREHVSLPGPDPETRLPGVVSFAPSGSLAVGTGTGMVAVWDPPLREERFTKDGPGVATFTLDHSADGTALLAAGNEGVTVWDTDSGRHVRTVARGVFTLVADLNSDGTVVATASERGAELWPLPDGEPQNLTEQRLALAVVFSPDDTLVVVSREDVPEGDSHLEVFTTAGELIATLDVGPSDGEHIRPVTNMVFTPDGARLITVGVDGAAVVWDTETWERVRRFDGHDSTIVGVDFDPSRDEVATASFDGTVRVWNVDTGTERLVFSVPALASDVSYSPDGRFLATAGEGQPVRVLLLDLDELSAEAESRLTRTWTDAECVQYLHVAECPTDRRHDAASR